MRAAIVSASLLVACVDAQSTATTNALTKAIQTCQAPLNARLTANQACLQRMGVIGSAITGIDPVGVRDFCAAGCMADFAAGYGEMGTCIEGYTPTLTAALRADGVSNPELTATTMTGGFRMLPLIFNMMCMFNERGDLCMPGYAQVAGDLPLARGANNSAVCEKYYNYGCCLSAWEELQTTIIPSSSILTLLQTSCPVLRNFSPPRCVAYGQSAVGLSVDFPIIGLVCAVYLAQAEEFRKHFETALRNDLAAAGINASYTSVKAFAQINAVCTANLVVRADTDAATKDLMPTISAVNSPLIEANQAAQSASGVTTGTLTNGSPTVNETTIQGQALGQQVGPRANSGAILSPSILLIVTVTAIRFL